MKHSRSVEKLSKMLVYILGRQPDEFGLVPDPDGYVKIKDLIKALAEEPGWRQVRLNQINQLIHTTCAPVIEMQDNRIRAVDRSDLFLPEIPTKFPKLVYFPVRQRAYSAILEKGLPAVTSGYRIILADQMELARRLGRRIDPSPVILTVNSDHARKLGATMWQFGNQLFLSDCLPLGSFHGPPPSKKIPKPNQPLPPRSADTPKTPGSYLADLSINPAFRERPQKGQGKRKNEWKRDRAQIRRKKNDGWPDA
ncbi:RNA 2'-phosphotransferase [Desulfosarcina sp.]|uniref:RNA 2'-phosphotransferase n=1 Tax=Desulfosarcina sp. TaxID=2027861 RepID=UPI00397110FC